MLRKNCMSCGFIVSDPSVIKTKEKNCPKCKKEEARKIIYYICPRCGNNMGKKILKNSIR